VAGGERRCSGLPPRRPVQNPQLLPHVRGLVALWRKGDNHGPIGFALADPGADAWQAANPHLLRAQALGLAGRRVGGPPPRRERIAECHSPGRPARMPRIVEPARYLWRQCRTLAQAIVLLFQLTGWSG